eukprot:jgi/Mesvir1/9690/Mv12169-RA.3
MLAYADHGVENAIYLVKADRTDQVISELRGGAELGYVALAFSRMGHRLVSLADEPDCTLTIWDTMTGQALVRAEGKDVCGGRPLFCHAEFYPGSMGDTLALVGQHHAKEYYIGKSMGQHTLTPCVLPVGPAEPKGPTPDKAEGAQWLSFPPWTPDESPLVAALNASSIVAAPPVPPASGSESAHSAATGDHPDGSSSSNQGSSSSTPSHHSDGRNGASEGHAPDHTHHHTPHHHHHRGHHVAQKRRRPPVDCRITAYCWKMGGGLWLGTSWGDLLLATVPWHNPAQAATLREEAVAVGGAAIISIMVSSSFLMVATEEGDLLFYSLGGEPRQGTLSPVAGMELKFRTNLGTSLLRVSISPELQSLAALTAHGRFILQASVTIPPPTIESRSAAITPAAGRAGSVAKGKRSGSSQGARGSIHMAHALAHPGGEEEPATGDREAEAGISVAVAALASYHDAPLAALAVVAVGAEGDPGRSLVFTGCDGGAFRSWFLASGEVHPSSVLRLHKDHRAGPLSPPPSPPKPGFSCMVAHPSGALVVAGTSAGEILVLSTGARDDGAGVAGARVTPESAVVFRARLHWTRVHALAIAMDGSICASCADQADGRVVFLYVKDPAKVCVLGYCDVAPLRSPGLPLGRYSGVRPTSLAWSLDGRQRPQLVLALSNGELMFLMPPAPNASGPRPSGLRVPDEWLCRVVVSMHWPADAILVLQAYGADTPQGCTPQPDEAFLPTGCAAVGQGSHELLALGSDHVLRKFLVTPDLMEFPTALRGLIADASERSSVSNLAAGARGSISAGAGGMGPIRAMGPGKMDTIYLSPTIETLASMGHNKPATCMALSPSRAVVATGGADGWVCLWTAGDLQQLAKWVLHEHATGGVAALAWMAEGLATAGRDGVVRLIRFSLPGGQHTGGSAKSGPGSTPPGASGQHKSGSAGHPHGGWENVRFEDAYRLAALAGSTRPVNLHESGHRRQSGERGRHSMQHSVVAGEDGAPDAASICAVAMEEMILPGGDEGADASGAGALGEGAEGGGKGGATAGNSAGVAGSGPGRNSRGPSRRVTGSGEPGDKAAPTAADKGSNRSLDKGSSKSLDVAALAAIMALEGAAPNSSVPERRGPGGVYEGLPGYLAKLEAEMDAGREAERERLRDGMRRRVRELGARLLDLKARNDRAEEAERLHGADFVVDTELHGALLEKQAERVEQVRCSMMAEMWRREALRELLRHQCVAPMEAKGLTLRVLRHATAGRDQVEVPNYPIRRRADPELGTLRHATYLRQVARAETEALAAEGQFGPMLSALFLRHAARPKSSQHHHDNDTGALPEESSASLPRVAADPAPAGPGSRAPSARPTGVSRGATPTPEASGIAEDADGLSEPSYGSARFAASLNPRGVPPASSRRVTMQEAPPTALPVLPPYDPASPQYHALELFTSHRRRLQVLFLHADIRRRRLAFNEDAAALLKEKGDVIEVVEDKQKRMAEISRELVLPPELPAPQLAGSETPDAFLVVDDKEIKVEKYLTAAERKLKEERDKAEEERQRLSAMDEARARALRMMMGGSLAGKRERDLESEREPWMDQPAETLSDEQTKRLAEYQAKLAAYLEEKEKARKILEAELRQLRAEVDTLTTNFDAKLKKLFLTRLQVDEDVALRELQIVQLSLIMQGLDDMGRQSAAVGGQLEGLKLTKAARQSALASLRREVEAQRAAHDALVTEDRQLDKAFRRDFSEHEEYVEDLLRLFRSRPLSLQAVSAAARAARAPGAPLPCMGPDLALKHWDEHMGGSEQGGMGAAVGGGGSRASTAPVGTRADAAATDSTKPGGAEASLGDASKPGSARPGPKGLRSSQAGGASLSPPVGLSPSAGGGGGGAGPGGTLCMTAAESAALLAELRAAEASLDPYRLSDLIRHVQRDGAASRTALSTENLPDGLEGWVWEKLGEFRDAKLAKEREIYELAAVLGGNLRELGELADADEHARATIEASLRTLDALKKDAARLGLDMDVSLTLKQGQVEVPQASVVTDYGEAVLMHRGEIHKLNASILAHGKQKLDILGQFRDGRRDIYTLQWECQQRDLTIDDLISKIKELQLLRVTKDLQAALKDESKVPSAIEEAALSARLQAMAKFHADNVSSMARRAAAVEDKAQDKAAENADIHEKTTIIESAMVEPQKILRMRQRSLQEEPRRHAAVFRSITTNHKLREIVSNQKQEMAELQRELKRLKDRTFPVLKPQQERRILGPDVRIV